MIIVNPARHSLRYALIGCSFALTASCANGYLRAQAAISAEAPNEAPGEYPVTEDDREHWAYRALSDQPPPAVGHHRWPRDPIDAFILKAMQRLRLQPMPEAERGTLIRRLYFDVTGLPPPAEAVERFSADERPDAYERLVDELLGSAAYGERWGQYWLDLARFAETDGFEHDHVRPNAWRYRDWVIDAFNRDVPYDQFIRLQIAGDQLSRDASGQIATGFTLCGPDMPDINDQGERRHVVLNEMTATLGSVVLALQIGCAQCHDHKYDPISQHDFYRLRAFFESTEIFKDHELRGQASTPEAKGRVLKERSGAKARSYLMLAGDFRRRGAELRPAFPRIANERGQQVQSRAESETRSDLRPQLADWLTSSENPLTARVIVNRIWQHHFGEGLVRTPSDFGVMGDEPRHPQLLDWLAAELIESGWSVKRLHCRIVKSATYRQSSQPHAAGWSREQCQSAQRQWAASVRIDPDNRYLARQNLRRLDAEAIRDALLACSGRLSQNAGGPGVMPPLPAEIQNTIRRDHWKVSPDPADHARRSIYLFVRRNLRYPFLDVFDRPDSSASCAQRSSSTIATQSLAMLNSELTARAASELATRLLRHSDSSDTRIRSLYLRVLGRLPDADEMRQSNDFLRRRQMQFEKLGSSDSEAKALMHLCLGMFNLNEFIYVE